jgi:hypothetical protein
MFVKERLLKPFGHIDDFFESGGPSKPKKEGFSPQKGEKTGSYTRVTP